jgi:hypothetical protein
MVHSSVDRPDLGRVLWRYKFAFLCAVVAAEARLLLYGFGLQPADAGRLLSALDLLRGELKRLAPATSA